MRIIEGSTAVITGGNRGIGMATAKEFRQLGACVIILGRNADSVAEAVETIGGEALGVRADGSRLADLDRAFAEIREKVGRVDILFANAGIGRFHPVLETTEEIFDEITDTNFKGVFFTIHRALPLIPDGGMSQFSAGAYSQSTMYQLFNTPVSSRHFLAEQATLQDLQAKVADVVRLSGTQFRHIAANCET